MGGICSNLCGFGPNQEEGQSLPQCISQALRGPAKEPYRPTPSVLLSPLKIHCQSPITSRKSTINSKSNSIILDVSIKLKSPSKKLSIEDFSYQSHLGTSRDGKLIKVIKKSNSTVYAIKIIKKSEVHFNRSIERIVSEKTIMLQANSPFIVKLKYSFQDDKNLYSCMEYVPGGRILDYLIQFKIFPEPVARFYAAEVILALGYIHDELDSIYRDLRPGNILLDEFGHIKLKDFGLSKIGAKRARSFCGNSQYLAPEILDRKEYDKVIDFWALGCFVFEMLNGYKAFCENNENILFTLIKKGSSKDFRKDLSETAID